MLKVVLTVANVRGLSRAGNIQSKGIIPELDKDRGTVSTRGNGASGVDTF